MWFQSKNKVSKEFKEQLKIDEGHKKIGDRHYPYDDADGRMLKEDRDIEGLVTIGYGHNLDALGMKEKFADMILDDDIEDHLKEMMSNPVLGWVFKNGGLDPVRREVLLNMAFNMGIKGLAKWKKTLAAAEDCDFEKAGREMVSSRWFTQVGDGVGGYFDRAERLVREMRTGVRHKRR